MMQHDYIRTQLRLPKELHERASKFAADHNLSLNELFLKTIPLGLQHLANQRRRLMYNDHHSKQDSESHEDYMKKAADFVTDFLQRHPSYELVTVESLETGLRYWYTYPVDENGKEINYRYPPKKSYRGYFLSH